MGFSRLQSIKSPNETYQFYVLDVYNDLIEIPADIQTRAICVDDEASMRLGAMNLSMGNVPFLFGLEFLIHRCNNILKYIQSIASRCVTMLSAERVCYQRIDAV